VPVVSSRPMGERENAAAGQAGRGKASGYDHDRTDMRRMGKKQKLRRDFRMISTIGFTTCVMGTWEILLTLVHAVCVVRQPWEGLTLG